MMASSNSTEVGVVALENDNKWVQWILNDADRADLPLTPAKQDSLPIGVAFYTGSTKPFEFEEKKYSPLPVYMVLSDYGVLSFYNVLFTRPGASSV